MQKHLYILTGASRGMGLAMARLLLQQGHHLLTLSRRPAPELEAVAAAQGATLEQWSVDLTDAAPVARRLQQWLAARPAGERWHSATLINNAGVIPPLVPLSQGTPDDLAQALRVGLEAPMQLCAAFLGASDGWAIPRRVLNISSGLGRRAMASQSAYCAAKAGMDHFTRCLALDEAHKPQGAKVCSLAPGVIDTDMQLQLRGSSAATFPDQANFAALKNNGQLTRPQDAAARLLAYLERPDFGTQPVADVRDA
ncbi:MAG: SDR family NAD(P)-dependent oxidoreductase [Curvibacter sp.]|nr:SDR family NAD(P)-dependent oxidoreductase [Curvibacter sp.]